MRTSVMTRAEKPRSPGGLSARIIPPATAKSQLATATAEYERQIDELVDEDEETTDYVAALEARFDAGETDDDDLTDASSLVEEVERFLRSNGES